MSGSNPGHFCFYAISGINSPYTDFFCPGSVNGEKEHFSNALHPQ